MPAYMLFSKQKEEKKRPLQKLTTYATNDALDAIALIQSRHRRATGERIPVWKVVNDAILTYAEKQGIRLSK